MTDSLCEGMRIDSGMTAGERQQRLIEDFLLLEDSFERFQLIVETGAFQSEALPENLRTDENLVPGCVSRVWLAVWQGGAETFEVRADSESPALKSIAALFCRIYSGSTGEEIFSTEPDFIRKLEIDRHLTPTRLRGLSRLREKLVGSVRDMAGSAGIE
ncbi:MAG: SufE family protein [Verrucomicrobiales bacterium]|nr:SufE family protein [Verrucomicrobiales bacterium]HQW27538.1 SufE family protein [Verrucomicrobiales bacterium]